MPDSHARQGSVEPCPLCGSTDEDHTPTPVERKAMRRLKWRSFWRGFFRQPGLTLDEIRDELRCS